MEENLPSYRRAVLLGALGFAAMCVIGGLSVVIAKALTPPQKQSATIQSDGLQIVDKDCVEKLNELQRVYDNEQRALEERTRTIESITARYTAQMGEAIPMPESLSVPQAEEGFKTAMKKIGSVKTGVQLVSVHCDIYPCIAVFQSRRDNVPSTLKTAFREQGYRWSHRWVAQGKSEHAEGSLYFAAIRFLSPKGISTKQARFLSEGLDDTLDKAMNEAPFTD